MPSDGAAGRNRRGIPLRKAIKDAGALYFQVNPQVGAFIEAMLAQDLTYLVHENLNESWSALYHVHVVADFAPTRLSYACSAHIADDIDERPRSRSPLTRCSPAFRTASGARPSRTS
jgi:Predicted methyltransferase regulatory domain